MFGFKGTHIKILLSYDTLKIIARQENVIAVCLNILGDLFNMCLKDFNLVLKRNMNFSYYVNCNNFYWKQLY